MSEKSINELTAQVRKVMTQYQKEFPDVLVDRDYYPFKLTEEWGECLQTYLMLTDRGRQKGKSKEEIQEMFASEFADVFGFMLLFAEHEQLNIEEELQKKWFSKLK